MRSGLIVLWVDHPRKCPHHHRTCTSVFCHGCGPHTARSQARVEQMRPCVPDGSRDACVSSHPINYRPPLMSCSLRSRLTYLFRCLKPGNGSSDPFAEFLRFDALLLLQFVGNGLHFGNIPSNTPPGHVLESGVALTV